MKLGRMLAKLEAEGIAVDDGAAVTVNVARELKIARYADGSPPLFIRILERQKGERDFEVLAYLAARLGASISQPARILKSEDLVCGLFPFVVHEKFRPRQIAGANNPLRKVADLLIAMHAAGTEFSGRYPEGTLPVHLTDQGFEPGDDSVFRGYLQTVFEQAIGSRPPAAQHCDFTYANLGLASDGALIVFDWEQYGMVRLPGFDFTTFLVGHHHQCGTTDTLVESPDSLIAVIERDFGRAFLGSFGFTADAFAAIFPAYLQTFWKLKRDGFGAAINRRMQSMWRQLRGSESWVRVMGGTRSGVP